MLKIIKEEQENNFDINKYQREFDEFVECIMDDEVEGSKEDLRNIMLKFKIVENNEIYMVDTETTDYDNSYECNLLEFLDSICETKLDVDFDDWQWRGIYRTEYGNIMVIGEGWDGYIMNKSTLTNVINNYLNV